MISQNHMKNKKIIIAVVVLILIVVGAVSYSNGNKPVTNNKIKVGVVIPLSGQYASFGESVKNSMEMSLKDLQNNNIEIIFEDGQFDSAKGLSAYNKLQSVDNVDIVVGLDSPTLEVLKPKINQTDELMLTVGNESTVEKDNVFEVIPWATELFKTLGKEVSGKYKKVAIVYASDSQLFMTNKNMMIQGLSNQEYIEVPVSSNSDVRTEVSKMLDQGVDSYTVFLGVDQGVKFINEVNKQSKGVKPQIICDGNIELSIGDYLKKGLTNSAFEGCLSTMIADNTSKDYLQRYKAAYNSEPNFLGVYGYDAVQVIGKVLAGKDKKDWKATLEKDGLSIEGMSGKITFDKTGSRTLVSELHIFKDGKFVKFER